MAITKVEEDENGELLITIPQEIWDELGLIPYDGMEVVWHFNDDEPGIIRLTFPDLEAKRAGK